jgi:hypothetical protein
LRLGVYPVVVLFSEDRLGYLIRLPKALLTTDFGSEVLLTTIHPLEAVVPATVNDTELGLALLPLIGRLL